MSGARSCEACIQNGRVTGHCCSVARVFWVVARWLLAGSSEKHPFSDILDMPWNLLSVKVYGTFSPLNHFSEKMIIWSLWKVMAHFSKKSLLIWEIIYVSSKKSAEWVETESSLEPESNQRCVVSGAFIVYDYP